GVQTCALPISLALAHRGAAVAAARGRPARRDLDRAGCDDRGRAAVGPDAAVAGRRTDRVVAADVAVHVARACRPAAGDVRAAGDGVGGGARRGAAAPGSAAAGVVAAEPR